jgi:polyisoprenyl-teichoic acid--peptidoglycan teichoic acid transferase
VSTPRIAKLRSHPPRDPKRMPSSRKLRSLWLMLGLGGVAIISATAGALLAMSLTSTPLLQSKLSQQDANVFGKDRNIARGVNFRLPQLTRPVNILVLGVKVLTSDISNPPADSRNLGYQALVNSFEGLSDVMLLFRFNPENQQLAVLSLPRDTRTWVEGAGTTKLNEANVVGGPALSAKATSGLLGGVSIDRYVRINVQGVQKLIDALGGVKVFVPKDMHYQDESQHLYINLKRGEQHLNGDQALQFLRFRYDENGDIGRIQRQQMLMRAVQEQALSPATLTRLPQILSVIQSNVDTNLSIEELVALVGFAAQTNRSNVDMLMLPGSFSEPGQYDRSYWLPSLDRIQTMMSRYFALDTAAGTAESQSDYLRVAIQDSTGESDAARSVVHKLNQSGYGNVAVDNPWSEPLNITRIIAQQGDVASAQAIQRALGFGEVRTESTGSLQSDVTIQLGKDWHQAQ